MTLGGFVLLGLAVGGILVTNKLSKKQKGIYLGIVLVFAILAFVFIKNSNGTTSTVSNNSSEKTTNTDNNSTYTMPTSAPVSTKAPTPVPTVSQPDNLLSNGKYKYKDDSDGNRWYYEYDSNGNFKYKTATIKYPDWYYGPEKTFHGQTTDYTVSPPTFTDSYDYVKSFDIYVELSDSTLPAPAEFTVYVQEPEVNSKLYTDEGKMYLTENEPSTFHVELDRPTKVTAVCPRPEGIGSFSWSFNILNLEVISYEYETY